MTAPNELSFLPEDYLVRKARRRANILCGGLSAVMLVGLGAAFTTSERSTREVERRASDVDRAYTDAARRIEQVKKMHDEQRSIVHHAELAASLVEKVPRSNLLAEVTNALPPGVYLLDLVLDSKPRTDPPPVIPVNAEQRKAALMAKAQAAQSAGEPQRFDVHLRLTGVADTDVQVAQFISRLNQSRLLRDVNLVISDVYKQQDATLRQFQIEMMINPDAEVHDDPKALRTAAVEMGTR